MVNTNTVDLGGSRYIKNKVSVAVISFLCLFGCQIFEIMHFRVKVKVIPSLSLRKEKWNAYI